MADTNPQTKTPADLAAEARGADVRFGSPRSGPNATEGAQSVAEAVRRVADAAVAEIQRTSQATTGPTDFHFSGTAGGKFIIQGSGFSSSGTVLLNGTQQLRTREWSSTRIVGDLPADAKHGEVIVRIDEKTEQHGQFRG